jgi:hypothetical protein
MAHGRRHPKNADVPHPRYGDTVITSGSKLSEAEVRNSFWGYGSAIIFPESAITADVSRQNFSIYPRRYYVDILKKCRNCDKSFLFFAKEQLYWYEVLGFYIDADCVHCPECRVKEAELRRKFQRYSQSIGQSDLADREFATLIGDAVFLWTAGVLIDEQKLRWLRNQARRRIPEEDATKAINDLVIGLANTVDADVPAGHPMQTPIEGHKTIFTRQVEGRNERVEWIRQVDSVWIIVNGKESILRPEDWRQAWIDLHAHGYIEVFPTDRRKLQAEKTRVVALIREAFAGVTLGDGIGLQEAEGLDSYASGNELASYRAQDEKLDWSAIPAAELDRCSSSVSYFDAEGMLFHLPAYMVAELDGSLNVANVVFHMCYIKADGTSPFSDLSPAQREAVRQFLQLKLSDNDEDYYHLKINEALRGYWNDEPGNENPDVDTTNR